MSQTNSSLFIIAERDISISWLNLNANIGKMTIQATGIGTKNSINWEGFKQKKEEYYERRSNIRQP
jgi:hypothetical protein